MLIIGIILGSAFVYLLLKKEMIRKEQIASRARNDFNIISQWLILKQNDIRLDAWLKERNINKIAVYGMGILGRCLIRELINTDVEISYGIDCKKMKPYNNVPINLLTDQFSSVDLIIITVAYDNEKIKNLLSKKIKCEMIDLENIVYESYIQK